MCRTVDEEIVFILKKRKLECDLYYGKPDREKYCARVTQDLKDAEINFHIKCESSQ